MQERYNNYYSKEQNWIIFRTPVGSRHIPAGESVRLNDGLPNGIPVADFETIRLYARCRPNGTVPVTFSVFVLDVENDEIIFRLASFTIDPKSEDFNHIYKVPGRALVVFAQGGQGTGGTGIDFGVLGFGPRPHNCRHGAIEDPYSHQQKCFDNKHGCHSCSNCPPCPKRCPGPIGPTGPTGPAGPTGPTGPSGVLSSAYAGVVSTNAQTVENQAAVQFLPPVTEINNVAFNGTDLFTIIVPGNYFCIGYISPTADHEGPITVGIGFNGPGFGLFGSNYGTAAGQQIVCFGFTGEIPAGSTLGLYNVSGRAIALGATPARMAIYRVS